jgi:hypothetical protein
MKFRNLLLSTAFLLGAGAAFAQAPQQFNYQAVARNGSGNVLASQAVGIQIQLHQGTPGGTVVYAETHAPTTSSIGLMNLAIGAGTVTSGTFNTIDWSAGPYYVEIGMDATGGTTYVSMGTQQLLSVPYALYAENSATPGPTGPAGANGTNGTNGATGPTGAVGLTGPTGAAGVNGTNGATGATGADGATGPAGAAGATGAPGIAGPTGPAGANGTNGSTGATGPAGANGTNGATGATGAAGVAGPTGATGAVGATGPAGATGATGAAGVAGPTGATGAAGANGATGPAGATGATGAAGATGPTGPSWTLSTPTINTNGTITVNGTAGSGGPVTTTTQTWVCAPNTAGTNSLLATGFIGTSSNNHMDFVTNNTVRGRMSNLGEFFIGTTNTVTPGDLLAAVSNATFPWATSGYSSFNGGGTYGSVQAGTTNFAGVQGEYAGTSVNGAGVRGSAINASSVGVFGVENTGSGWAGYFNGDVNCALPFAYYNLSDQRLKTNATVITGAVGKLKQISGYEYDLNVAEYGNIIPFNEHKMGVMAQEIEKVFPELVKEKYIPGNNTFNRDDKTPYKEGGKFKAVNYDGLIPVLIEAIKEQQLQIDALQKKIDELLGK